ncbi:MAG: hypothetical protein IVW57_11185 [Ktedonobacterales bacterium]|nr:hypothetical protein [Ktedonobacterales bacterium]
MASNGRMRGAATPSVANTHEHVPWGSVRSCLPYGGELARHRVITADGHDFVVATVELHGQKTRFVTAAFPVQQGYLVMVRQPLCELRSAESDAAREAHEKLVHVLAEAGVGVVRARRALAARRRAEHAGPSESGSRLLKQVLLGEMVSSVAAPV